MFIITDRGSTEANRFHDQADSHGEEGPRVLRQQNSDLVLLHRPVVTCNMTVDADCSFREIDFSMNSFGFVSWRVVRQAGLFGLYRETTVNHMSSV